MEDYPKPVKKKNTEKILSQMDNAIYKIKEKNEKYKFCFFCYIKHNTKKIPTIIINNYSFEENQNNSINIIINNRIKEIKLGKIRYKNKDLNISIIEIEDNDINNINFLEIDDDQYKNDFNECYYKESIYILQYDNENDISVSYGVIKKINNSQLIYSGNVNNYKPNYHGCPIFNLMTNKLIGIHNNKSKYYNNGILLKYIINKFIQYLISINEIIITIHVNKDDISNKKDIYFLSNYIDKDNIKDDEKINYNNNSLKELNKFNSEIYINKERKEYKTFFKPEKEGEYLIKLIFRISLSDCSYMFAGCKNIIKINFNTENVVNMKYMFYKCENLQFINLLSFNTNKVTDMSFMFSNCEKLNTLSFEINYFQNEIKY